MTKLFSPEAVLATSSSSRAEKLAHHANLFDLTKVRSLEEIETAMIAGFCKAFGTTFGTADLTPAEKAFVDSARHRYLLQ